MKINKKNVSFLIVHVGLVVVLLIFMSNLDKKEKTEDQKIASFYENKVATIVSPHSIRKKMAQGDNSFILVDVRSAEEYSDEHVIGAINIPAYIDKENSEHTDKERIVLDFAKLEEDNPYKDIIIYCYSYACMTGKKIGHLLATNDIFVQELGVGWNEWRHFWKQWNYPHEWAELEKTSEKYIQKGPEAGKFKIDPGAITGCKISGDLGC